MAWRGGSFGKERELWQCGDTKVTIPRHWEVNGLTAVAIFKALDRELGRTWWRR